MNGTSAACPVATGIAALVFSVNPNLTAVQVRNLIEHTADKPGYINEHFDTVTGQNDNYGHGRVNAFNAVQAASAGKNWPSPVKDVQTASSATFAQIIWTLPDWDGDGTADGDVAGVLVARSSSSLEWAPTDGIEYTVGQEVAPGVVIVADDLIENLEQTGLPTSTFQYALFTHNGERFYSWGRRTSFAAESSISIPLASISASPTAGSAPLKVHFAGGGIDKSGKNAIIGFGWNFGDGTTATGAAVDHIFTSGGDFLVTLTLTNTSAQTGQATVMIHVSGAPNKFPTAAISAVPTSGDAPLVVLFQASASDSDGAITSMNWNFGDGTTGSGATVEHVYIAPGTYAVIFTATDNGGAKATASQVINVTGGGVTAARTEPPNALANPAPNCAAGAGGATITSLAMFLTFMYVRRR
jgi:PKD repeat protein